MVIVLVETKIKLLFLEAWSTTIMLASKQPRHNFVHIHVAKVAHEIQSRETPISTAHPEVLHHHSIQVRFLQNRAQNRTHLNSTLPFLDPVKAIERTC